MKKIRIGKDITIHWTILTNGEEISLENRDLKLVLTDPLRRTTTLDYSVEGNVLTATYRGVLQRTLGEYSLTLWENYNQDGQTAVDACGAFTLVPTTCAEGGTDNGLDTETVELSGDLELGIGGSGTIDYNLLANKPQINDIVLQGNRTLDELGLQPKGDYATKAEIGDINAILDNINGEVIP